jgi:hypothetical protein
MVIGDRLRELREAKKLSQGDIEKRTGLLRCYIFEGRERPHGAGDRDARKIGASFRDPAVSEIVFAATSKIRSATRIA